MMFCSCNFQTAENICNQPPTYDGTYSDDEVEENANMFPNDYLQTQENPLYNYDQKLSQSLEPRKVNS